MKCWLGCPDRLRGAVGGGDDVGAAVEVAVAVDVARTDVAGAESNGSHHVHFGSCKGVALQVTHPGIQEYRLKERTLHGVSGSRPRVLGYA